MDAGKGTGGERDMSVVFISGLVGVVAKIKAADRTKMQMATNELRNEVLQTLEGSRSGKTYYVPGTKRTYTASAPGEPPAVASGRMKGNIRGRVKTTVMGSEGEVGTSLDYPRILELKMDRVWLALGAQRARAAIKRILRGRWF